MSRPRKTTLKILVISDIHANLTALESVLSDAGNSDAIWCLGDLVGYGPDGNECVSRIRELPNLLCVRGNHDLAICGDADLGVFNHEASEAILVSRRMMAPDTLQYLRSLPEKLVSDLVTLIHGSPRNPVWEYILDTGIAAENFSGFNTQLAFVGHSHLPLAFTVNPANGFVERSYRLAGVPLTITTRAILNPGSVGQPRDNDPRASYGVFDPESMTWEIHRVPYDIPSVQQRIINAGLPEKHARRLSAGW